jgi:hypothetical protein
MRIIDVDAHLHEPLDWIERTDPLLAAELSPPARFMDIADAVFGVSNPAPLQRQIGRSPMMVTRSMRRSAGQ